MGDLTENFSKSEFVCKCGCGEDRISADFVERLQLARNTFGRSLTITSGCRCPEHNKKEGGKENSSHLVKERNVDGTGWTGGLQETCLASDILCKSSRDRFKLIGCLLGAGIRRLGIAEEFIHVDIDPDKDDQVAWLY